MNKDGYRFLYISYGCPVSSDYCFILILGVLRLVSRPAFRLGTALSVSAKYFYFRLLGVSPLSEGYFFEGITPSVPYEKVIVFFFVTPQLEGRNLFKKILICIVLRKR